jgi:hypothetical protein
MLFNSADNIFARYMCKLIFFDDSTTEGKCNQTWYILMIYVDVCWKSYKWPGQPETKIADNYQRWCFPQWPKTHIFASIITSLLSIIWLSVGLSNPTCGHRCGANLVTSTSMPCHHGNRSKTSTIPSVKKKTKIWQIPSICTNHLKE